MDTASAADGERHPSGSDTTPAARRVAEQARRGGRLFLGAFGAFVAFVATIIVADVGGQQAQNDAARELGVGFNELPVGLLAAILADHPTSGLVGALLVVFVVASVVLFTLAVWVTAGVAGPRRHPLALSATGLAALGLPVFPALMMLEVLLARGSLPTWAVENWHALYGGLVSAFVVLASLAMVLLLARLWPTGLARRTSIAVGALSLLSGLAAIVVGAPPIVPMLLGAILALSIRRGVRRTTPVA
jgi:hypothetical protein